MCTHGNCPIRAGRCITEKPGWEWAEKFGLPSANATQRRFLVEQSARWNDVVVHEGEAEPNPQEGSPCAEPSEDSGTVHLKPDCGCGKPSLLRQAATFAKAAAKHAADGFSKTPPDEVERRRAICRDCPLYLAAEDRCSKCGCYVGTKSTWASESCPLDKWEATPPEQGGPWRFPPETSLLRDEVAIGDEE